MHLRKTDHVKIGKGSHCRPEKRSRLHSLNPHVVCQQHTEDGNTCYEKNIYVDEYTLDYRDRTTHNLYINVSNIFHLKKNLTFQMKDSPSPFTFIQSYLHYHKTRQQNGKCILEQWQS